MDAILFVIGKIVGLMIRFETWLVLLALFVALSAAAGRARRAACAAWVLVLALVGPSLLPLGDPLLQSLERSYPANPPLARLDGVIVLGGAEDAPGTAYWQQVQLGAAAERYTAALMLARRFPAAQIVFTGGSGRLRDLAGPDVTEADVAREFFLEQGLSPDRLQLEPGARNTSESARRALDLARPAPGESWVLLTSAAHMPRAMHSFETAGWRGLIAYPVDYRTGRYFESIGWNLPEHLDRLDTAMREWVGQIAYLMLRR